MPLSVGEATIDHIRIAMDGALALLLKLLGERGLGGLSEAEKKELHGFIDRSLRYTCIPKGIIIGLEEATIGVMPTTEEAKAKAVGNIWAAMRAFITAVGKRGESGRCSGVHWKERMPDEERERERERERETEGV